VQHPTDTFSFLKHRHLNTVGATYHLNLTQWTATDSTQKCCSMSIKQSIFVKYVCVRARTYACLWWVSEVHSPTKIICSLLLLSLSYRTTCPLGSSLRTTDDCRFAGVTSHSPQQWSRFYFRAQLYGGAFFTVTSTRADGQGHSQCVQLPAGRAVLGQLSSACRSKLKCFTVPGLPYLIKVQGLVLV